MKINTLALQTGSLEELYSFYCRTLGLRDLNTSGDLGRITVQAGLTILTFRQAETGWQGHYHFAFNITPERYQEARLWLAHRAPALSNSTGAIDFYHEGWNARSLYFHDPAGNILELIARYGRENEPAGPVNDPLEPLSTGASFGPHDILCVSEIGMAADNVEGAAAVLASNVPGLEVYEPGEKDTFRAMGDESGLLVLARRGRIWYPETGIPAEHLPLEATFEMPNGQNYHLSAPPYPFQVRPA